MAKMSGFKIEVHQKIKELEKTMSFVLEMVREDIRTGHSDGTSLYQIEAELMKALGESDVCKCLYCGDDRSGKASLFVDGMAFCNELHHDRWVDNTDWL